MARYYDNFTLKLEGMQVLVAEPGMVQYEVNSLANYRGLPFSGDDWQLAKSQGASSLHILNPTGLQLQLKQSIVKKDAYLPRLVPLSFSF